MRCCKLFYGCRLVILAGYLLISVMVAGPGSGDDFLHEQGEPFLDFFMPEATGGAKQNWVILQAKNGLIYVGSSNGLLEYDGSNWRRYIIPNGTVRALAEDATGRLFVGGKEQFGYMQPDSLGTLSFISLAGNLKSPVGIGEIWNINILGNQVYFHPKKFVLRWDGEQVTELISGPEYFPTFLCDGRIFLQCDRRQLLELREGRLDSLAGFDELSGLRIKAVLPWMDGQYMVLTFERGLFQYDGRECHSFAPQLTDSLKAWQVTAAKFLSDSTVAIATRKNGVVFVDHRGKLCRIINREAGLISDNVKNLAVDAEGSLWLALADGVARISYHLPLQFWDSRVAGRDMTVTALTRFQGDLYVAATSGVARLAKASAFQPIAGLDWLKELSGRYWDLLPIGDDLLIAGSWGINLLRNNRISKVGGFVKNPAVYCLTRSRADTNRVFFGGEFALGSMYRHPSGWKVESLAHAEIGSQIKTIEESAPGIIWAGTSGRGIAEIRFPDLQEAPASKYQPPGAASLTPHDPLAQGLSGSGRVFRVNERCVFTQEQKTFYHDEDQQAFIEANNIGWSYKRGEGDLFRIAQDVSGAVCVYADPHLYLAEPRSGGSYTIDDSLLSIIRDQNINAILMEEDAIWFGSNNGVFCYNRKSRPFPAQKPEVLFRNFREIGGDTLLQGEYAAAERVPLNRILPSDKNNFRLELASSNYIAGEKREFRYRLLPSQSDWSRWSSERTVENAGLSGGDYQLEVQARDHLRRTSKVRAFEFSVATPWYLTLPVMLGLGLLLITGSWSTIYVFLLREREKKYMREEIETAKDAQKALIPKTFPEIPGYSLAGACLPAYDVGGDHYDHYWLKSSKKLALFLVDVEGKRMKGAIPASLFNGLLNGFLLGKDNLNLAMMAAQLDSLLFHKLGGKTKASIILATLDASSGEVEYVNAGCSSPVARLGGEVQELQQGYMSFNEALGDGRKSYGDGAQNGFLLHRCRLQPGDSLVIYSDGIADARNAAEKKFFPDMLKLLEQMPDSQTAAELLEQIMHQLEAFKTVKAFDDDKTLLIIKRHGSGADTQ